MMISQQRDGTMSLLCQTHQNGCPGCWDYLEELREQPHHVRFMMTVPQNMTIPWDDGTTLAEK